MAAFAAAAAAQNQYFVGISHFFSKAFVSAE
jgi:hypothetical protein